MKKYVSIIMCVVFMFLCSCQNKTQVETTKPATQSASSVKDNITELNSETETAAEQATLNPYADVEIETSPNDPYSFIIKELFDRTRMKYDPKQDVYFLYDIDNNGVDELIIGSYGWIGPTYLHNLEPYYMNYGIFIYNIYTIKDNTLTQISTWWYGDSINDEEIILNNGVLKKFQSIVDGSYKINSYSFIENGEHKQTKSYILQKGEYYYSEYPDELSETKITKEEYERGIKEIEAGTTPVEIKWTPLHEYKPVDRIGNG